MDEAFYLNQNFVYIPLGLLVLLRGVDAQRIWKRQNAFKF